MSTSAFELDRFTAGDDRLEVSGRWVGVRGRRFVRPSLTASIDGHSTRALAELEHKPWAPEAGDEWVAAFPWRGGLDEIKEFELAVAPDLSVRLPPPDPSIHEVTLPVVAPEDGSRPARVERPPGASPARVERGPEPPRGQLQELREQADAARHNAIAVRDRALADLDAAVASREGLRAELQQATADRGRLCAELDHVAGEVERLRADFDRAMAERRRALKDRDRIAADRERIGSEQKALEAELGRVRAELRMAQSQPAVAAPAPRAAPTVIDRPVAPPTRIVALGNRRSQSWAIRALAVALIVAALVVLIVVLTSGPASVAR